MFYYSSRLSVPFIYLFLFPHNASPDILLLCFVKSAKLCLFAIYIWWWFIKHIKIDKGKGKKHTLTVQKKISHRKAFYHFFLWINTMIISVNALLLSWKKMNQSKLALKSSDFWMCAKRVCVCVNVNRIWVYGIFDKDIHRCGRDKADMWECLQIKCNWGVDFKVDCAVVSILLSKFDWCLMIV